MRFVVNVGVIAWAEGGEIGGRVDRETKRYASLECFDDGRGQVGRDADQISEEAV